MSAYSSLLRSGSVKEEKKMNQETKEPLFTNLSGGRQATLDYIFHTGIPDIYDIRAVSVDQVFNLPEYINSVYFLCPSHIKVRYFFSSWRIVF